MEISLLFAPAAYSFRSLDSRKKSRLPISLPAPTRTLASIKKWIGGVHSVYSSCPLYLKHHCRKSKRRWSLYIVLVVVVFQRQTRRMTHLKTFSTCFVEGSFLYYLSRSMFLVLAFCLYDIKVFRGYQSRSFLNHSLLLLYTLRATS
jgi:hypothetical protein